MLYLDSLSSITLKEAFHSRLHYYSYSHSLRKKVLFCSRIGFFHRLKTRDSTKRVDKKGLEIEWIMKIAQEYTQNFTQFTLLTTTVSLIGIKPTFCLFPNFSQWKVEIETVQITPHVYFHSDEQKDTTIVWKQNA